MGRVRFRDRVESYAFYAVDEQVELIERILEEYPKKHPLEKSTRSNIFLSLIFKAAKEEGLI